MRVRTHDGKPSSKLSKRKLWFGMDKNTLWGLYIKNEKNKIMSFERFCKISKIN